MLPGEGEPSEKGKGADFTRGGFCPLNDRCREDDPDCIPELGYGKPTIVHWGDSYYDKLDRPVDLHFHPEKPCELWVLNQGDFGDFSNAGSFTVFYNPGSTATEPGKEQISENHQDTASCHFMPNPTAFDFGGQTVGGDFKFSGFDYYVPFEGKSTMMVAMDNQNNFRDMGHPTKYNDYFMGATLFSGDNSEFAIKGAKTYPGDLKKNPHGGHLSMLHQMPNAYGSTYAGKNASFYMWDDSPDAALRNASISFIEFKKTHGFGGADHTNSIIRRYEGTDIRAVDGIPGQMTLQGKWLYVADPGNRRIFRMDVESATCPGKSAPVKPVTEWRELYDEYSLCHGQKMESLYLADLGIKGTPVGLTFIPAGMLLSTREDGKIHFIRPSGLDSDISTWKREAKREIHTGSHEIGALTVDSQRRIWTVDREKNLLTVLEPRCATFDACANNSGGQSPWENTCQPAKTKDGKKTLMQDVLEHQKKEWGYDIHEMGGCARGFFFNCPGGTDPVRTNICGDEGLTMKDACVAPGLVHADKTCTCQKGGCNANVLV
jgi:hypothetical protein